MFVPLLLLPVGHLTQQFLEELLCVPLQGDVSHLSYAGGYSITCVVMNRVWTSQDDLELLLFGLLAMSHKDRLLCA